MPPPLTNIRKIKSVTSARMDTKKDKKVFVAMSGGVDSSLAAALLKEDGYEVTGVFIKVWQPEFLECTWIVEREDAMRVCALLDIPFLTFDFEEEYKRDVVDYMVTEYRAGRTPNPDVMCNARIKFGAFYEKAIAMGADYIATGHYARRIFSDLFRLLTAKDMNKDQTYFLWTLKQDVLSHTLFPIGEYEKPNVRERAEKFGLPTAKKKDSQGLCFIGKLNMKDFLKRFIPEKRGDVLDINGTVIGNHDGAMFYTLGERHGFTLTKQTSFEKPHYIVAKDIEHNTITVSTDPIVKEEEKDKHAIHLLNVHWIAEAPKKGETLQARSRYRQKLFDCILRSTEGDTASVTFSFTQPITPNGQSLVFYRGEECLGGGVIQ